MPARIPADRQNDLRTPPQGLAGAEANARLVRYGANDILEPDSAGWREIVLDTVRDPMLWFLLGTSLLFALVGDRAEAAILLAALVPLFGMDAWLHRRTRASRSGLSQQLAETARVRRDGVVGPVPATALVPGDLLELAAGEVVPADGVVLRAEGVQIDESALTGESYPVRKAAPDGADPFARALGDAHWLRAGTRLLAGSATAVVVCTGAETLYGEIVRSASRGAHELTPLQIAVAQLVRVLLLVALAVCVVLAWVRIRQGHGLVDALLSAVTLAVAAIPEEFPVVLTVFLGVGIYRLARRQALVRRAVVVENVGRVSCICTDKTGTLTEGQLQLAHLQPTAGDERNLLRLAAMAARADTGDPMDVAILAAAPRLAEAAVASFPFTEDRRRETGIYRTGTSLLAAAKGAPEVILALCELDGPARQHWLDETAALAAGGHKVIAVAERELDAGAWPGGEPDRGFRLAGLIAFEDPLRDGVREALDACRAAGIRVIMVTGDHPVTARAIAEGIGLREGRPGIVEGSELESRLDAGQGDALLGVDVVARAAPAQKLRLVRELQARGEIVAVTGDGVNDVPALQAADIGIAMGGRGTRSAREVAAIVLLDDNFRSIVRAIAEGRQLFSNLRLSFEYLLMIHLPLVVTAAAIPLAGYPLLYLPIHIVWLELLIHPTALLVFQSLPSEQQPLRHKRRLRDVRFFDRAEWLLIALTGLGITGVVLGSYVRSLGAGYEVEHARTMALVALTLANAGVTAALSRLRDRPAVWMVGLTVVLAVTFVQVPWIAGRLHLQPLHADDWLIAVLGGLAAGLLPYLVRLSRNRP